MDSIHSMPFSPMHPVMPIPSVNDSLNRVRQVDLEDLSFIKDDNDTIRPVVFIFLGSDCPISQKYGNTLRNLYGTYKDSVNFYGIFPESFTDNDIAEFKQHYQIGFDLQSDVSNRIAKALRATHTPQTFLIDQRGKVLYQGAIDNWFYALGKNRRQVTEHYLEDAIKFSLGGYPITVTHTQPIGCFIEFKE